MPAHLTFFTLSVVTGRLGAAGSRSTTKIDPRGFMLYLIRGRSYAQVNHCIAVSSMLQPAHHIAIFPGALVFFP
jgi:hypothetical protein